MQDNFCAQNFIRNVRNTFCNMKFCIILHYSFSFSFYFCFIIVFFILFLYFNLSPSFITAYTQISNLLLFIKIFRSLFNKNTYYRFMDFKKKTKNNFTRNI